MMKTFFARKNHTFLRSVVCILEPDHRSMVKYNVEISSVSLSFPFGVFDLLIIL